MTDDPYKICTYPGLALEACCAVPIEIYTTLPNGSKEKLGIGTAFCERVNGKQYLVTNWHCVSGRNPTSGQPINEHGALPTFIHAFFRVIDRSQETPYVLPFKFHEVEFSVSDDEWIMHNQGRKIDIAATAIPNEIHESVVCLRDVVKVFDPRLKAGDDVFILGYPRGVKANGTLPIWKRGSIATGPIMKAFDAPCFLVDAASREGMSGSPVLAYAVSDAHIRSLDPGSPSYAVERKLFLGRALAFVGVYSGRVDVRDEFEAQIGRVWWPETVHEMLTNPAVFDGGL